VDETDIGNVAPGNAVTFTVEAYPSRELTGSRRADRTQGHDRVGRREL
jgi:multidrug resistance efflux pump